MVEAACLRTPGRQAAMTGTFFLKPYEGGHVVTL